MKKLAEKFGWNKVRKWLNSGAIADQHGAIRADKGTPPPLPCVIASCAGESVEIPTDGTPVELFVPQGAEVKVVSEGASAEGVVELETTPKDASPVTPMRMMELEDGEFLVLYAASEGAAMDRPEGEAPRTRKNAMASALRRSRTNPGLWIVASNSGVVATYEGGKPWNS